MLPDIPASERPRYLLSLSYEEYSAIPKPLLNEFLSPLFPLTRPDPNRVKLIPFPKKIVKHAPTAVQAAKQFTAQLGELLKQNAALPKK